MHVEQPVLLVVEDDFLVRLTLVDALTDDGFDVIEAADAQEALGLVCERGDIAAMLTDINLPGGSDGFALARAVRVIRPGLPVVYASGRYTAAEAGKSVEGAHFLAKPFTPSLATAVLRDLMAPQAAASPAVQVQSLSLRPDGLHQRAHHGRGPDRRRRDRLGPAFDVFGPGRAVVAPSVHRSLRCQPSRAPMNPPPSGVSRKQRTAYPRLPFTI